MANISGRSQAIAAKLIVLTEMTHNVWFYMKNYMQL